MNVVSGVKVESTEGGSTDGLSFIMDTDTYGFNFPSCVTGIVLPNGITKVQNSNNTFCSFPNLQTIVIPEGVTSIGEEAFRECTNLTSITIPSSVTNIGSSAFYYCSSLTSITIPESVTGIDNYAFYYCSKLKTINYTGTEEQWEAINKDSYWCYGASFNVIYNYKPE